MADIFVSYAREDRELAGTLAQALEARRFSVWWDRAGSSDEVIERELRAAACVVVLWSVPGIRSRWVREEAEHAAEHSKLIPVLLGEQARGNIPSGLRAFQYIDLTGGADAEHVESAADEIADVLSYLRTTMERALPPLPLAARIAPKRWGPMAKVAAAIIVAIVILGGWFATRQLESNPFAAAADLYKQDHVADAVATLRSIGAERRFEPRLRLDALDAAAQILVESGRLDSAQVAIAAMLDMEPPLILIAPEQGATQLGLAYDLARKERFQRSNRRPRPEQVSRLTLLPFQRLAGGIDYAQLEARLRNMLKTEQMLDPQPAVSPPVTSSDEIIELLLTGKRAFYTPTIKNHILTGSFVADRDKVVMSAWILQVDSAFVDAVAVVSVPPAKLLEGIQQLARQIASQLNRPPS